MLFLCARRVLQELSVPLPVALLCLFATQCAAQRGRHRGKTRALQHAVCHRLDAGVSLGCHLVEIFVCRFVLRVAVGSVLRVEVVEGLHHILRQVFPAAVGGGVQGSRPAEIVQSLHALRVLVAVDVIVENITVAGVRVGTRPCVELCLAGLRALILAAVVEVLCPVQPLTVGVRLLRRVELAEVFARFLVVLQNLLVIVAVIRLAVLHPDGGQ